MKILPVSTLKVNNYTPKINTFSNYAQRFMTSQIRSVLFNFERIFDYLNYKTVMQDQELMRELGIKRFGKNKKVGLILYGKNYTYRLSSQENNILKIDLYNKKSQNIEQSFLFEKNKTEYTYAGSFSKDQIEDVAGEILDDADGRLLDIKRKYDIKTPAPFLPDELTSEKIQQLNKMLHTAPRNFGIKNFGQIDEKCQKVVSEIVKKFQDIKILFKKIPNDASRFNVRSYYKNYDTKQSSKNILPFLNIGPKDETISVFYTTHKHKPYVAVKVKNNLNEELNFVISKEGTVQRNLPYRNADYENTCKRKNSIPDYLTQKEIDDSDLFKYLKCLNKELVLFKAHTKNWLKTQADFKKKHVNKNVATLEMYSESLEDISQNFQKYKKNVVKYIPKLEERNKFKKDNNVSTELSTTAVTLKNITPEGYDLRLSYPIIPNKTATQILVMDGERVDKSFYILDNKLLKFDIKKKSDRFIHYNRKMYFYDRQYVQKSELDKYLEILCTKIQELNEKLYIIKSKSKRRNIQN